MSKTKIKIRSVKNGLVVTIDRQNENIEELVWQKGNDETRKEEIQNWITFLHELTENIGPMYDKYSEFNVFNFMLPGWRHEEVITDKDVKENISNVAHLCDLIEKSKTENN